MSAVADDILGLAAQWRSEGRGVALATVVKTWGSAPRPAGSQLVIRDDGTFQGSVSGGCVEGSVVEGGAEVIREGGFKLLRFGVTNDMAWEVGLACGGEIEIFLEKVE